MKHLMRIFLVVLIAVNVWGEDSAAVLEGAKSGVVEFNDQRIHYENLGEGKTALVYIHGWCGDVSTWRLQLPVFRDKIRQIAIDLPGYGKSDKPQIDYSMDHFANAINAVLLHAGVDRAILVGFSMGAPVIRQFYRLYPQKVAGLVLADGSVRKLNMPADQVNQFIAQFSGPDFESNVVKFIDSMTTTASTHVRDSVKNVALQCSQQAGVSSMKAMFQNETIWKEDPISVPLLSIVTESPNWQGYEEFLKTLAPKSEYHVITGSGRFVMMEKPEEFNSHLAEFLKKQGWIRS